MFKITDNKGFHITFENGWTVSVQWGAGNYGDNYDHPFFDKGDVPPSTRAEIAAWDYNRKWHEFESGDTVNGYVSPDEVAAFISLIQGM